MFVSKKKYDELASTLAQKDEQYESLRQGCLDLTDEIKRLSDENTELDNRVESLMSPEVQTGGAETKFEISANLLTVTPVVKYDPVIFEKLVELGYLNDTHQDNKFAIQLAVLTVTHEALTQIIDSFSENLKE